MITLLNLHTIEDRRTFRDNFKKSVYIGPKSGNLHLERSKWMYPQVPYCRHRVYVEKAYREWLAIEMRAGRLDIGELVEKYHRNGDVIYLAGWHYPQPCHGDVLLELMEIRLLEDHYVE